MKELQNVGDEIDGCLRGQINSNVEVTHQYTRGLMNNNFKEIFEKTCPSTIFTKTNQLYQVAS